MSQSIRDLQSASHQQAIKSGWHSDPRSIGDLICLMHSELSEALEEHRSGHLPNEIYESNTKPEGIPIELADCVIRIMDFCSRYGIDLEAAIVQKMAFNATRPYKHGGKTL